MLELLTGSGLALAAGLNAFIPLLGLGLLSRYTDLLALPEGWQWIESTPALVILGVLLLGEMVADKIPAVDSVNDVLQTVVRPASGGLVFAAGSISETSAVTDPATLLEDWRWVPVVLGVLLALTTHTTKALSRPVIDASTVGVGAPVASTAEDASAVGLVLAAVLVPVLVGVVIVVAVVLLVVVLSRWFRLRGRDRARPVGGPRAGRW